jgi:hypothetical protein
MSEENVEIVRRLFEAYEGEGVVEVLETGWNSGRQQDAADRSR